MKDKLSGFLKGIYTNRVDGEPCSMFSDCPFHEGLIAYSYTSGKVFMQTDVVPEDNIIICSDGHEIGNKVHVSKQKMFKIIKVEKIDDNYKYIVTLKIT